MATDIVVEEFNKTKKDWDEAYLQTLAHIQAIQQYGKSRSNAGNKESLPRLNGLAQDGLAMLSAAQFNLDLLVPQLPTDDHIQNAQLTLQSWNKQIQRSLLLIRFLLSWNLVTVLVVDSRFLIVVRSWIVLEVESSLRSSLRNANLQAKANMRKAAQEEVLNLI
ncbi:hypothetical protein HanIR_Chr01g0018341 [Helianthus annuus]|nr:hypothetical protein HanIR_Chr01g0018341 [Helianthus annuus]